MELSSASGGERVDGTRSLLLVGTKKGVFIGTSDAMRREWCFSGPHCSGTWAFNDVRFDPLTQTIYAGGMSNWYGASIWRSADLGETWTHSADGLTYGDDGPTIEQLWCVVPAPGPGSSVAPAETVGTSDSGSGEVADRQRVLYAGVDPAGLFRSVDGGRTWREVSGVRAHPSSTNWRPTNGGTPLHAIVHHPDDPRRMWVAISAGGVLHTEDGGETWGVASDGVDACVHALEAAGTDRLYLQNHQGVFRSDDGGTHWRDASAGLPSRFGFPLAAHPHDPETLYAVPLEGAVSGSRYVAGRRVSVWRTRDGGGSWHALTNGLPQAPAYFSVYRRALATDQHESVGVFFGTTGGQVYGSVDGGEQWFNVAPSLPPVYSIACATSR